VHEAFLVETETLKPKTKVFSLEAEARARYLKFQPRRDRAEELLCLETASRPRHQDRGHIPVIKAQEFLMKNKTKCPVSDVIVSVDGSDTDFWLTLNECHKMSFCFPWITKSLYF